MKIYSITGFNPSGIGLWVHNVPEKSSVRIEQDRMIVAGPHHEPYVLLEDGSVAQPRPRLLNSDDGA